MMKKMGIWIFVAGAISFASVATAQPPENACAADQEKFCGDAQVGAGGVLKCMDAHFEELSPDCKALIQLVRDRTKKGQAKGDKPRRPKGLRAACKPEVEKHCKEMIGKPKKVRECLKEHEGELSEGCKTALQEVEKRAERAAAAKAAK